MNMSSSGARLELSISRVLSAVGSSGAYRDDQFDTTAIEEKLCGHARVEKNFGGRLAVLEKVFEGMCACFSLMQRANEVCETDYVDCVRWNDVDGQIARICKEVERCGIVWESIEALDKRCECDRSHDMLCRDRLRRDDSHDGDFGVEYV
jgi:hypothetical protein